MHENEIATIVLDSAISVHKVLGPGLLESAYEECLCHELKLRNLKVVRQLQVPVNYKGVKLECAYRCDLVVEDKVIIEIKSVSELENIHLAQTLTYLKLTNMRLGLLINFNVELLKYGFKRVVNNLQ